MEKYKICPSCHTKNEPTFLECVSCEADLTRVKITDEETEKMIANNANEESPNSVSFVRFCECGTKNPPNARKCSNCGEDIFDIVPTPDNNEQREKSVKFVLSSTDGKYAYEIPSAEIIIGRENAMSEYLSSKSYVSIGNTRVYFIQGGRYLKQVTEDDTTLNFLLKTGRINDDEAENFDRKNEITACFGGNDEGLFKIDISDIDKPNSSIMITSDGIHDYLTIDQIEDVIIENGISEETCRKLTHLARENGSCDDISVLFGGF